MLLDLLHIVLTAAACFALWRFWGTLAGRGRASLIIVAGFLIRAFGGQVLFWISYLKLPIARPLQLGDGFWFFAIDGPGMLAYANTLIHDGPVAVIFISTYYPSHVFIQVFTTFAGAFGTLASVAILMNCAAYLATCAIIVRLASRDPSAELPLLVALSAIAFGPGTILWSLQVLKDTFLLFLIAAMIAACFRWQQMWRLDEATRTWRRSVACAAAMIVLTYAIAGTRWYLAVFFWGAWAFFGVLTALPARPRSAAFIAQAVVFVLLAQAVSLGGSDDIPRSIRRVLEPWPSTAATWSPSSLTTYLAASRRGFENTPGATAITVGTLLLSRVRGNEPGVDARPPGAATDAGSAMTVGGFAATAAGFAALFLPRTVGQSLGLVRIGGGRGFWLFVELDTLVFDAVLLFAIGYCTRSLRVSRVTPLFVLLVIVFVATAGPLVYTVTNFGTLFRMRQMLYVIIAILPLTVAPRGPDTSP